MSIKYTKSGRSKTWTERASLPTEKNSTVSKKSNTPSLTSEYLEELSILRTELNDLELLPEFSEDDLERMIYLESRLKSLKDGYIQHRGLSD